MLIFVAAYKHTFYTSTTRAIALLLSTNLPSFKNKKVGIGSTTHSSATVCRKVKIVYWFELNYAGISILYQLM